MGLLDGELAIVTGGASGIGAATCRLLASEGATVAVLDVDGDGAVAMADEIDGGSVTVDVGDRRALPVALEEAVDELGGLSLLVNNAGIGSLAHLHDYDDDTWDRLLAVNLTSVFDGVRFAAPRMKEVGRGAIVNMASVSGVVPTRGEAPYSAAKAAVVSLTQSAALEYGPEVRVNAVSPGFIRTPLTEMALADDGARAAIEAGTPLGRVGTAEEVALVVAFLLSSQASYVTGQNLVVDGGSTIPSLQTDAVLRSFLGDARGIA